MEETRAYYDKLAAELDYRKIACRLDRKETISILSSIPEGAQSLLDVGCGTGRLLDEARCRLGIGIDFSVSMLRLGRRRNPKLRLLLADARRLPFKECSFEVVTSQDVIGHFPDPKKVTKEMVRCCVPGGRIILTATRKNPKSRFVSFYVRMSTGLRVRTYRPDELQKIFEVSGGQPISSETIGGSMVKLIASRRD